MAETSSAPPSADKPVIVRVKRKASQSALDAFWLEILERPLKRPFIDFEKLSISEASSSTDVLVNDLKTRKILVRHVETVTTSKDTFDVLRSFVPSSFDDLKSEEKIDERKRSLKTVDKHDQLLFKARQKQEVLSRNARFEQIWRSRKVIKESPEDEAIYDMCRLYDVLRVDSEELVDEVQNQKDTDADDCKMMADFLPLLREMLPAAAEELEQDIHDVISKEDGYVYDVYSVLEGSNVMGDDDAIQFPLIQVDDDNFYDGPDDPEYESDDSNAENNPLNDYPDEEESEDDDDEENTSRSSDEKSEGESTTSGSESEDLESGSQLSYEFKGSEELYEDWSDYGDESLEDCDGQYLCP